MQAGLDISEVSGPTLVAESVRKGLLGYIVPVLLQGSQVAKYGCPPDLLVLTTELRSKAFLCLEKVPILPCPL
jgi:hypothetical protein